jgi:hypothetical protein
MILKVWLFQIFSKQYYFVALRTILMSNAACGLLIPFLGHLGLLGLLG